MKTILTATALAVLSALPAAAQQNCAPHAEVVDILTQRYSESVVFRGIVQNGTALLRVWGNPATGSWTLTATNGEGLTCILAEGQAGETIAYVAPAGGDPA